jgi:hypothetical protein
MRLGRASGVLAAAGVLILVVWVTVRGQSPRQQPPKKQPAPSGSTTPAPTTAIPGPAPTRFAPSITYPAGNPYQPVQPASASGPYAFSGDATFPMPGSAAPPSVVPIKLQLASGLMLEGVIDGASPFPCQTSFGEVSIPPSAIRGIRLHAAQTNSSNPLPAATIILHNNDCVTVSLRATQIQIKTTWGMATVDLPHAQSLLLTSEAVEWQQVGDRWTLSPIEEKPAPAADPTGTSEAPAEEPEAPAIPGTTTPIPNVAPPIGAPNSET